MSGASLSVPGVLYVGTSEQDLAVLHVGPATGWIALKGLHTWSREISVALKAEVTEAVRRDLRVILPEGLPEAAGLQNARRAAMASSLVAVDPSLVDKLAAKGVRVHTVGSDRITGGFYYFAKGGAGAATRAQGNLVEMVAAAMPSADNAALEASLDGIIDRLLAELSGGAISEAQIELAAALPALGEPAEEAAAKLQTLEGFLALAGSRASKYEEGARAAVDALGRATRRGEDTMQVPLFGDARRVLQPEIEVEYAEGEAGTRRKLMLPERSRWLVAGLTSQTVPPPAVVAPSVAPAAPDKAAADKAAADKAAAEKAAAAKAAAERAAAEKAAAEKAAAEKAAAEKAAAEKAAAEKAAAEKAAAEKAAAEKAAAEKAAAEKAAAEKAAAEKAAAEKAAAEKAAAEKAAAREKSEKAEKKPAAEKKRPAAQPAAAAKAKSGDKKSVPAKTDTRPTPIWFWLLLLVAAVGAYYFAFARHHH